MKRSLLISGLIAVAALAFIPAGISNGELDLPGLNQAITNLDARTTNNTNDIKALQAATGTTSAPQVDVPTMPAQNTALTASTIEPATSTSTSSTTSAITTAPAGVAATPVPTAVPTATPVPTPLPPCPTGGFTIYVVGSCQPAPAGQNNHN